MGGKNFSYASTANYELTAGLTCSNEGQTIMWGPSYPDFTDSDTSIRGRHPHLETYTQWSAPNSECHD
jgi:hypothetical protein